MWKLNLTFTHFAKADYVDKSFADKQFKEFNDFVAKVESKGVKIPIHQCANSAAMMEMPETSLTAFQEQEFQCMVCIHQMRWIRIT